MPKQRSFDQKLAPKRPKGNPKFHSLKHPQYQVLVKIDEGRLNLWKNLNKIYGFGLLKQEYRRK